MPAFSDLPLRGHIRHEFATLSSSLLSMRLPQLIHYPPAVPPSNQPPTFPALSRLSLLQTLLSPLLTLLVVARPFVVEWPIAIAVPDRFLVSAARWRARNPLSLAPHGKSQCSNYLLHGTPHSRATAPLQSERLASSVPPSTARGSVRPPDIKLDGLRKAGVRAGIRLLKGN